MSDEGTEVKVGLEACYVQKRKRCQVQEQEMEEEWELWDVWVGRQR